MVHGSLERVGRRGRRPTNPQVILDGLEELLEDTPLRDLSVEDILGAAGVSRATFYSHFATKYAAAAALFGQVLAEVERTTATYSERPEEVRVLDALRRGIEESIEVWSRHGSVLRTVVENAARVPELAGPLEEVKRRFAEAIAAEIERERAAGLAPPGHDATELSAGLVECTLQLVYRSSLSRGGTEDGGDVASVLMTLWCGAVYRVLPE